MTSTTDKVVGLIPVVIATDIALRVTDRTFPRERRKQRRQSKTSMLDLRLGKI